MCNSQEPRLVGTKRNSFDRMLPDGTMVRYCYPKSEETQNPDGHSDHRSRA
jgi:hypothetical protein